MGAEVRGSGSAPEVKPGGIKWLRFFSQMRKSGSKTTLGADSAAEVAEPSPGQAVQDQLVAIDHAGYAATPTSAPVLASLALPAPEAPRRTVAETLATSLAPELPGDLPAELLDEELPLATEVEGLLPPLPPQSGPSNYPQDEPEDVEVEEQEVQAPVAHVRPSSFRRNAQSGHSASSSRPTTAGEESAATAGTSRQSAKSSWREEWTPGKAANDDVSLRSVWQPAPPPRPIETATTVPDPNFTLALKRASESANTKSALAPALGHRRWSKSEEPALSSGEEAREAEGIPCPQRAESPKEASKLFQRGFTDLAMSFASLDETL